MKEKLPVKTGTEGKGSYTQATGILTEKKGKTMDRGARLTGGLGGVKGPERLTKQPTNHVPVYKPNTRKEELSWNKDSSLGK